MTKEESSKEPGAWVCAAARVHLFYGVGFITLIIAGTLILVLKRTTWPITVVEVTCAISFGLGFCIRAWPVLVKSGRNPYGKGALALFHAIVLVISSIPAKNIVSEALRLPSGDFPVTLAMWALLSYPAVWLVGTAVLGVVTYALLLLAAALAEISRQPLLNMPIRVAATLLPTESTWRRAIESDRSAIIWRAFGHAIGAAIVSCAIAAVAGWWFQTIHQPRLVKLFAYTADYESAPAYPGVDPEPFRLHDNGVVSYATRRDWDVKIRVEHVKNPS